MSSPSSVIASRADWLADQIERRRLAFLILFSIIFFASCLSIAATKIMWNDELTTHYPATLPTTADLLAFFREGFDLQPPTSALLTRASIKVFGDNHAAFRVPYIFGFWLMSVCIFRFVARRCPPIYGAAAMIFPLITSAFYYASEARPYALVMGFTALALVFWQQILENERRAISLFGLWVSLAACICLHYYAILIWIPFGLAELARCWVRKRPDWPVWIVILAAIIPLLLFVPGIQAGRANYAGGWWARPHLSQIENAYRFMLTLALAPALAVVVLWAAISKPLPSKSSLPGGPVLPPLPERILVGSLAALPVFGVPLSFLTGGFVERYALASLVGITIFLAFTACTRSRGNKLLAAVMVVCFSSWFVLKTSSTVRKQMVESGGLPMHAARPFQAKAWMRDIEQSALPVAATPLVFYHQFQYYVPDSIHPRVYYLASRKDAMHYDGMDTGDNLALVLSKRIPLQVPSYESFVASNPHFLLCAETTNPTWHIEKLLDDGARLKLVRRQETYFLFDVTMPDR
jgi:hypothetical protein